ncbi:MAG: DUF4416 family protein [Candidatus Hydrogenedentota bacterium]
MGNIRFQQNYKLFCSLMYNTHTISLPDIESRLITVFGEIDDKSDEIEFTYTDYYNEEMGSTLNKVIYSFANLINPEKLPEIKIKTNSIEEEFCREGDQSRSFKRMVNLDPGYLTLSKIALLTTKDYSHRIYLGRGIHCEVTLIYKNKSYTPLEWTYPDYRTLEFTTFFNRVREKYKSQLSDSSTPEHLNS